MRRIISCIFCGVAVLLTCNSQVFSQFEISADVADALHLNSAVFVDLELDVAAGKPGVVEIEIEGHSYELELHPRSIRSKNFVLKEQLADGSFRTIRAPISRTMTGAVRGDKGSQFVGSVLSKGLAGVITMSRGTKYYIQPMNEPTDSRIPVDAEKIRHVMYRADQVRPVDAMCGNDHFEAIRLRSQRRERIRRQLNPNGAQQIGLGTPPGVAITEVGVDADFEFFTAYGSTTATVDRIELILSLVNDQYEREVAITHVVSGMVIRSMPNDPYTSTDANGLLDEMREEWNTNQLDIPRDIVHLFSGKFTPGIGGAAFLNTICSFTNGFGFSSAEALDLPLSCNFQVAAHELGHNWGANHCNCQNNTMFASINCTDSFADETIDVITTTRRTRNCLEFSAPANDDFENRIQIPDLPATIVAESRGATTQVGEPDLDNTGATVWWTVVAPETGIMRVDLEGSSYDTQLKIFEIGESDSISELRSVAENDDEQNTLQSDVSFPVIAGQSYEIRVGGVMAGGTFRSGDIAMSVSFLPEGPVEFFWSATGLGMGSENNSNPVGEFAAGSSGSLYLYYDPMFSEIDNGAFLDIATSDDEVIEFSAAESLEFDIVFGGVATVGVRWGDAVGETGEVESNFVDELGALNVFSGSGMLLENTGPDFVDQGFDFGVNSFLFARVDFEVVGEVGDTVNIITTRGATQIANDGVALDPVIGSFTITVGESEILLGDLNCDGEVNLLDVAPFVEFLSNGTFSEKGDFNSDGMLNLLDVSPFVDLLSGN